MPPRYFCGKCHHELPSNASFCPNCKVRIGGSRDMNQVDRKQIEKNIKQENRRRRERQKAVEDQFRNLDVIDKNARYLEKLSQKCQQQKDSKFARQLLTPLRLKRLLKAMYLDYGVTANRRIGAYIKMGYAFGKIGKPSIEPLLKTLEDDNEETRLMAALALAALEDDRAISPLMEALKLETKTDVRIHIVNAVRKFNKTDVVDTLIGLLSDSENKIRCCAAFGLGLQRDDRAIEPLIHALEGGYGISSKGRYGYSDTGGNLQAIAASALGKFDGENVSKSLEEALQSKHQDVRHQAKTALEAIERRSQGNSK